MSSPAGFNREDIDIADVLGSSAMVGMYRGQEVSNEIERLMDQAPGGTLVLFDIRKANPLQYEFCHYAFGPLMRELGSDKWQEKHVIFQMHDYHRAGFFRGVLKHLGTELPRRESEEGFIQRGFYCKLVLGDEESITFVGSLTDEQRRVLDLINHIKHATARRLSDDLALPDEAVVYAVEFLVRKHFVAMQGAPDDRRLLCYHSYCNYFQWGDLP